MTEDIKIMSKVLVHETNDAHTEALKNFFSTNNLIGLRAGSYKGVMEALNSNIDLGAVFLCEDIEYDGKNGIDLAIEIHKIRTELPIFLRKSGKDDPQFPDNVSNPCAAFYSGSDTDQLKELVERYLFNTYYPSKFIRGIEELSRTAIQGVFRDLEISCSFPYLVRDRLIYGEMFSVMGLEGNWCRGFMMLQSEEGDLSQLIASGHTALPKESTDFRTINNLLSETTNMIWGSFKTRFFSSEDIGTLIHRIQVPIIVNHARKYISFGSEDPQLCFQYTLQDSDGSPPTTLYQKFAFNLAWAPDEFVESKQEMEQLVETGELELF